MQPFRNMTRTRLTGKRHLSKKLQEEKKEQERIERAEKWMEEKNLPKSAKGQNKSKRTKWDVKHKITAASTKANESKKQNRSTISRAPKSKKTEKPERVVSEKIVLDTNVVLDSWKEIHVRGMHQLLKKSNVRILLTETTLGESTRKLKRDKKTVLEHLEKRFGDRLEPVRTTSEMTDLAKKMEKKYPEKLHHPDSIIFAAAKIMEADLITNDQAVKECCVEEEINAFDHRLVKIIEKKKKQPARPSTPKKTYYDKDGNKITAKEYRKLKESD